MDDSICNRNNWTPRIRRLHDWLTNVVPCYPATQEVRAQLEAKGMGDAIAAYMNWVDRYIPPRPRRVMGWGGFWTRNNPRDHADKLNVLINLMREGGDLTPYLSRYVSTHGFEAERERKGIQWQNTKKGHKDFALNAYDVHHLHLSPADASGRHPGGSRRLLYVGVSRTEVLLLMLGDHNSFDDGSLHMAVSEHRATAGWDVKGIQGARHPHSPRESVKLLRHGIGGLQQGGEKFVVTSLMSALGGSPTHLRWADRVCDFLDEYEPEMDTPALRPDWWETLKIPDSAPWRWGFHYGDFGVIDERTQSLHLLLPWRR